MDVDFYEVLCIERSADAAAVRKAYKRLALECHPDKVPAEQRDQAEIQFKLVCEAYETLSDPASRAHYDTYGMSSGAGVDDWQNAYNPGFGPEAFAEFFGFGTDGFTAGGAPSAGAGAGFGVGEGASEHGASSAGFGYSRAGSAGVGGNKPRYRASRTNGQAKRTPDAEVEIEVTLVDVYKGRVLRLSSRRDVLCKSCDGTGARAGAQLRMCTVCEGAGATRKLRPIRGGAMQLDLVTCETCQGRGELYRQRDQCRRCSGRGTSEEMTLLEVYVPPGARDGQRIVLQGKADEAYGCEPGDIVVVLQVSPHAVFTRQGQDLHAFARIGLREALLGIEQRALVTHLDGRGVRVQLPPKTVTKPNTIWKIAGEGLPSRRGDAGRGDLYLHVDIEFPETIDDVGAGLLGRYLPPLAEPRSGDQQVDPDTDVEIDSFEPTVVSEADLPTAADESLSESDCEELPSGSGCSVM